MRSAAQRPPLKLPFKYENTREVRVISLESDGILCIPVLGRSEYRTPRKRVAEHTHPECIEISYCLRGELAFSCMGKDYPFRTGSVFVTRPEERHRLLTPDKGLRVQWMFFRVPKRGFPLLGLPTAEAEWLKGKLLNLPNRLFSATKRLQKAFSRLFFLCDTLPPRSLERRLQLRLAVLELLLAIVEASGTEVKKSGEGQLAALIEEMREHPEANYRVDDLASRASLSPSNLAVRFKEAVGLPPHAFLIQCRIAKAKKLLKDPSVKVADVAARLGFPSAQHFATQFKAVTGQTPCETRRKT